MKRFLSLFLASVMILAMAGCGNNNTPAPSSTAPAANPSSAAPAADPDKFAVTAPVKIEFWHAVEEQYRSVLEGLVDEFEVQNPNITVDCLYQGSYADINEKFLAANTAGGSEMPSLSVCTNLAAYAGNGILEPLDEYIAGTNFPIDEFAKGMVEAYRYDDMQYGIPFLNSSYVWFYNKDMADAEGIEMPKHWNDIDAFMKKASKPTLGADGTPERYAAAFGAWDAFYFEWMLYNQGVELIRDDNTTGINTELAVSMSEQMQAWCDANMAQWCYGKGASGNMRQAFMDKKIFAVMHTSSIYETYKKGCDFEVGVIFPPAGDVKQISGLGGCTLVIPSSVSQEQKNAAWLLMQYLTSPESNMAMVEATGYLPTRPSTIDSDLGKAYLAKNPNLTELYSHLDDIVPQPNNPALDDMKTKWESHLAKAINEKGDMKAELAAAEKEINEILADQ